MIERKQIEETVKQVVGDYGTIDQKLMAIIIQLLLDIRDKHIGL